MYKYIHSLHHRNTDIEPFAGLSMHPVEHLYYFTSIGPSLLLFASPFTFLWNAYHLIIAPAAGHSGWEDHFQADQFHYLHHRYVDIHQYANNAIYKNCIYRFFECNYGTSGYPMDKIFGTFRDKLKENGTTYKGGADEKIDSKSVAIHDRKASLTSKVLGFYYFTKNCNHRNC